MIHLNKIQRVFSRLVREELMKQQLNKAISEVILIAGQNYGFCNEEITQIVDECHNDLLNLIRFSKKNTRTQ